MGKKHLNRSLIRPPAANDTDTPEAPSRPNNQDAQALVSAILNFRDAEGRRNESQQHAAFKAVLSAFFSNPASQGKGLKTELSKFGLSAVYSELSRCHFNGRPISINRQGDIITGLTKWAEANGAKFPKIEDGHRPQA